MTSETRKELTDHAPHGQTVLLTRDYDILISRLARLEQNEHRLYTMADYSPILRAALEHIRAEQPAVELTPLEVLHIPAILAGVNRTLNEVCDRDGEVCLERLGVATRTFIRLLEARP